MDFLLENVCSTSSIQKRFGTENEVNIAKNIFLIKEQLALLYERMVKENFYLTLENYSVLVSAENILKLLEADKIEWSPFNFNRRDIKLNGDGKIYVDTGLLIQIIDVVNRVNEIAEKCLIENYLCSLRTDSLDEFMRDVPRKASVSSEDRKSVCKISLPTSVHLKKSYVILPACGCSNENKKNKYADDPIAQELLQKCIQELEAARQALEQQHDFINTDPLAITESDRNFPIPESLLQPSAKVMTKKSEITTKAVVGPKKSKYAYESKAKTRGNKLKSDGSSSVLMIRKHKKPQKGSITPDLTPLDSPASSKVSIGTSCDCRGSCTSMIEHIPCKTQYRDSKERYKKRKKSFLEKLSSVFKRKMMCPSSAYILEYGNSDEEVKKMVVCVGGDCYRENEESESKCGSRPSQSVRFNDQSSDTDSHGTQRRSKKTAREIRDSQILKCTEIKSNETTNLLYKTTDGKNFCISLKIKPQSNQRSGCDHTNSKQVYFSTLAANVQETTEHFVKNQFSRIRVHEYRERLLQKFSQLSIDNIIRIRKKSPFNNNELFNAILKSSKTFDDCANVKSEKKGSNTSTDYYISLAKTETDSAPWVISSPQVYYFEVEHNTKNFSGNQLKYKLEYYINLTRDEHVCEAPKNLIYDVRYFEVKKYYRDNENCSTSENSETCQSQHNANNREKQRSCRNLNRKNNADKKTYLNIHKNNLGHLASDCARSSDEEADLQAMYNFFFNQMKEESVDNDLFVLKPQIIESRPVNYHVAPVHINPMVKNRRKKPEYMLSRSKSLFNINNVEPIPQKPKPQEGKTQGHTKELDKFSREAELNKNSRCNKAALNNIISHYGIRQVSQPNVEAGMENDDMDMKIFAITKYLEDFEKRLYVMSSKIKKEPSVTTKCMQTDNRKQSETCQTLNELSRTSLNFKFDNHSLHDEDNIKNLIHFLENLRRRLTCTDSLDNNNQFPLGGNKYFEEFMQLNDHPSNTTENDYVVYQCTCDCNSRQSVLQRFWKKSKNVFQPKYERDFDHSPSVQFRYQKSQSRLGCAHSCDFNHLCPKCGLYIPTGACRPSPYTKFCCCLNSPPRANVGTDPFCTLSSFHSNDKFEPCICEENTKICSSYKIHLCECLNGKVSIGLQIQPVVSEQQMNTMKPFMEDADTQLYKIKESISFQTLTVCTCNKCKEKSDETCDCSPVQTCGTSADFMLECDCPLNKKKAVDRKSSENNENNAGDQKKVSIKPESKDEATENKRKSSTPQKKDDSHSSSPAKKSQNGDTIPLPPPTDNHEP